MNGTAGKPNQQSYDAWRRRRSPTRPSPSGSPLRRHFPKRMEALADKLKALPGWVRGLAVIDRDTVLVGSSSASVWQIDVSTNSVTGKVPLGEDVRHAVFEVAIDPRS